MCLYMYLFNVSIRFYTVWLVGWLVGWLQPPALVTVKREDANTFTLMCKYYSVYSVYGVLRSIWSIWSTNYHLETLQNPPDPECCYTPYSVQSAPSVVCTGTECSMYGVVDCILCICT